jgi:hypothetical protein
VPAVSALIIGLLARRGSLSAPSSVTPG